MDTNVTPENLKIWRGAYDIYSGLFLKIIDKNADTILMSFNRMQRKLYQLFILQVKQGIPIRWLIVKNRQQGCSTWLLGLFFWLATLYTNRNCLVVNYDSESAGNLFNKVKLFYKLLPRELKPLRKLSNRKELYFANPNEDGDPGLESRIIIDTAGAEDPGVSYTFQWVLLSEIAIWESQGLDVKTRLAAVKQSVPKRPGTGIFIETTPRGEGYVSSMWDDEDNGYTKIFISSVADEQYRKEISPAEYFTLEDYEEHKFGDEEQEYEYFEKEVKLWYPEFKEDTAEGLQKIHHEVMCRLAWRREMINDECEGDKKIFDREYPITIEKAFATSGSNVFDVQLLKEIKKHVEILSPRFTRYKFKCNNRLSSNSNDFYSDSGGSLKIYEEPIPNAQYIIGADTGQGIQGGDFNTILCRRLPELQFVFSYEAIEDSHTFALILHKLHLLYNNAFMGIEINEKGGYATVQYLLDVLHCTRMYKRQIMLKPNEFQEKYGWATGDATKGVMISDYRSYLNSRMFPVYDFELIKQLIKYKLMPNGHTGCVNGHDDLAVADMICVQMAKFVHLNPEQELKPRSKFTGAWWVAQLDNPNAEYIGATPRGPSYDTF